MNDAQIVELGLQSMTIAAKLAAPILLVSLLIGFAISLFQSVTQIQEATLSFVPKAVGVGIALLVSGNWMLHELVSFTEDLFGKVPALLGAGWAWTWTCRRPRGWRCCGAASAPPRGWWCPRRSTPGCCRRR